MAPFLFREIKGINFSCSSPASAATCSSIRQTSIVQPTSNGGAIGRHTPHLTDPPRRIARPSAQLTSASNVTTRKSSADLLLVSPADSSRCLLESTRSRVDAVAAFYDIFPAPDPETTVAPPLPPLPPLPPPVFPVESLKSQCMRSHELAVLRPSASTRAQDQVVELKVSLHCKGCEGKVRRHIAKMQGVRFFNVDLAKKKVTVVGDVTPVAVLNSISRVKHAQLWQSPPRASASF